VTDPNPGADRSYKRSWKNLLINKRYQLRFTLFMVGLASVLMLGLGLWVMRVANETTEVSTASVRGKACPKLPLLDDGDDADDEDAAPDPAGRDGSPTPPSGAPSDSSPPAAAPPLTAPPSPDPATAAADPTGSDHQPGDGPEAAPATAASPTGADRPRPAIRTHGAHGKSHRPRPSAAAAGSAGSAAAPGAGSAAGSASDDEPRHVQVQIDESSMTLALPPDLAERAIAHWSCEFRQVGKLDRLERDRLRIQWAMIATGLLLVLGLAIYGIKMTHRVAGPLFKVTLYLTKMRAGRFDKVYNLRKGDQLVEFYDHFKLAHDGVVQMQRDDIAQISAVIAAAEAAGAGAHPAVGELRELLARKEKAIE
jgi:hypothetical protein